MRVIVFTPNAGMLAFLQLTAESAGFDIGAAESTQELCSALYRESDAIGVMTVEPLVAAATVGEMRIAGVRNPLFLLFKTSDLLLSKIVPKALAAGADDCQPLPIDQSEYIARLLALARRDRGVSVDHVELPNGCRYFPARGVLEGAAGRVTLSRLEADLLNLLVEREGQVVSKQLIMDVLYSRQDEPQMKIVDVFTCKIRRKILAITGGMDVIETVWGLGYRFTAAGFQPVLGSLRVRRPA